MLLLMNNHWEITERHLLNFLDRILMEHYRNSIMFQTFTLLRFQNLELIGMIIRHHFPAFERSQNALQGYQNHVLL